MAPFPDRAVEPTLVTCGTMTRNGQCRKHRLGALRPPLITKRSPYVSAQTEAGVSAPTKRCAHQAVRESEGAVRLAFVVLMLGLVGIGAGVVAGSIAALGDAAEPHDPVIPAGARVAGLDVGGRRLSEAAALIDSRFAVRLRSPIHVRVGGRHRTLTARSIGLRFDALRSARRANVAARAAAARGDEPATVNVPPWVRYSAKKVDRFIQRVARVVARPARNARLRFVVSRLAIRPGRAGYEIDGRKLRARIERVLRTPRARRMLNAKRRRVAPAVTRADVLRRHPIVVTIHRRGFRLRVFSRGRRVASYRVAIGMPGHRTPRGRFRVTSKAKNPDWTARDGAWAGAYRNEVVKGGAAETR